MRPTLWTASQSTWAGTSGNFISQPAIDKVDAILRAYADGGREEYCWRLTRGDKEFMVRVRPWLKHGKWAGLVHTVMLLG